MNKQHEVEKLYISRRQEAGRVLWHRTFFLPCTLWSSSVICQWVLSVYLTFYSFFTTALALPCIWHYSFHTALTFLSCAMKTHLENVKDRKPGRLPKVPFHTLSLFPQTQSLRGSSLEVQLIHSLPPAFIFCDSHGPSICSELPSPIHHCIPVSNTSKHSL